MVIAKGDRLGWEISSRDAVDVGVDWESCEFSIIRRIEIEVAFADAAACLALAKFGD